MQTPDQLREYLLDVNQLEALTSIQQGLIQIEKIRRALNELMLANNLPGKPLTLTELGTLLHVHQSATFDHIHAKATLEKLGLPAVPVTIVKNRMLAAA